MAEKTESIEMNSKDGPKTCKECQLYFPNIFVYITHLESTEHFKAVTASVMKQKYAKRYLEAKSKLDENNLEKKTEIPDKVLGASEERLVKKMPKVIKNDKSSSGSSAKDSYSSDDDSDNAEVYTCEVCEKICTGFQSYQLHLQGKKHQKTVKKIKLLNKMKDQKLIVETTNEPKEESLLDRLFPQSRDIAPNLECKPCKKKNMGPEAYNQHCKSKLHKKKVAQEDLQKGLEEFGLSPAKDHDNNDAPFAHCDICNKEFSGPLPYMQHMDSNFHTKKQLRINELGKIKNLTISNEEDSKLECKECGKMFSGPIPFSAHLKSSAHGKMKKKSELIEDLEKTHPEMVKTPAVEKSDGSEEDDGFQLGCKVCHVTFSGPESASDHFKSPKHKKALKKKAMFKQFKQQQKAGKLLAIPDGGKKATKSDSGDNSDFEEEFDIIN